MSSISHVLIVGATGSVGRLVTEHAVRQGYSTRALVRHASKARSLDPGTRAVVGDLTDAGTLGEAVDGIDAVVFTHGSHGGAAEAEAVDYGAVKNVLSALNGRRVRVALMTTIGVTVRSDGHDWKRRGERLVRASGNPYTIVRPSWFDYNDDDQLALRFLQGDTRRDGSPRDGVVSRRQIAQVLVDSLAFGSAGRLTFELVAERGPAQHDLDPLFSALDKDPGGDVDGVRDPDNLPHEKEPERVLAALAAVRTR
ncbi:SDR family oxidoreductase [Rhodococcoides fascians]|uniref:SDR family oxidoreductase n=1 Tax=Rhodococcoides fascians TaxID=1828 RepID=UPI00050C6AD2|nr:SDR family oxidoreductase [Rhodococcus fascians]